MADAVHFALEALPRVLPREDPDSSSVLSKEFKKRGINIVTGMILASAEVQGDKVHVRLEPTPPAKPVQVNDWDTKPGVEQTPARPPAESEASASCTPCGRIATITAWLRMTPSSRIFS